MELDKTALEAAIRVEFEGGNTQAVISAYLAALEPTTDPDGWIEWKGGDNPCGKYVFADIKLRGGNTWYNMPARLILWKHENAGNDTIAYRIHKGE